MRPIFVARIQCLLDEQATEARAIHEQLASDALAALEDDRADEAVVRALLDLLDLALDALDTALLGVVA